METLVVGNAKVMSKGQITLPSDIRKILGVGDGDKVTLIANGEEVVMVNSAVYAMRYLQSAMKGKAERAGFQSEEDVDAYIAGMRAKA